MDKYEAMKGLSVTVVTNGDPRLTKDNKDATLHGRIVAVDQYKVGETTQDTFVVDISTRNGGVVLDSLGTIATKTKPYVVLMPFIMDKEEILATLRAKVEELEARIAKLEAKKAAPKKSAPKKAVSKKAVAPKATAAQ